MSMLKFMPEGWDTIPQGLTREALKEAMTEEKILQGKVESCDSNCNLHINLGNGLDGVINRE